MGDLISRSALKEAFSNNCVHNCYYCNLAKWDKKGACYNCGLIDNAPTVPLPDFKAGYKQAILDGKTQNQKQQGEWLVSQTMDCHSDIIDIYTCPFCGKREFSAYPYCHCGAQMKCGAE